MCSIKDWIQTLGLIVGILVGLKALLEFRASRKQRAEELMWKRIATAKELLDDIHKHELARNAVRMLDWCTGEADYEILPGNIERIRYDDVLRALKANQGPLTAKDIFVCDCFDWFFYRIDRMEHYIRRTLIDFEDVRGVFKIYAQVVARDQQIYDTFLDFHGYGLAKEFFKHCLSD